MRDNNYFCLGTNVPRHSAGINCGWTYVVKSMHGEAIRGPARGWHIEAVLHAIIIIESYRGPRLMAADWLKMRCLMKAHAV